MPEGPFRLFICNHAGECSFPCKHGVPHFMGLDCIEDACNEEFDDPVFCVEYKGDINLFPGLVEERKNLMKRFYHV